MPFHASKQKFNPGGIVRAGNWGRIVRRAGRNHPYWQVEQVFERIRQERFDHLPTRLKATFSCPTEAQLHFFVRTGFRDSPYRQYLYQVEKVEPDAPEHVADFNLIKVNAPGETLEGQADRYWEGTYFYNIAEHPGMRCEEIVTPSALRILREIAP